MPTTITKIGQNIHNGKAEICAQKLFAVVGRWRVSAFEFLEVKQPLPTINFQTPVQFSYKI